MCTANNAKNPYFSVDIPDSIQIRFKRERFLFQLTISVPVESTSLFRCFQFAKPRPSLIGHQVHGTGTLRCKKLIRRHEVDEAGQD